MGVEWAGGVGTVSNNRKRRSRMKVADDNAPPLRITRITEAHHCSGCGAVCLSCLRTDETDYDAKEAGGNR